MDVAIIKLSSVFFADTTGLIVHTKLLVEDESVYRLNTKNSNYKDSDS